MSITYSECISVPLGIHSTQFASAVLYYLWPVPLYNRFPHYLINGTIFERKKKKVTEFKMCVLIFSTTFLGKHLFYEELSNM